MTAMSIAQLKRRATRMLCNLNEEVAFAKDLDTYLHNGTTAKVFAQQLSVSPQYVCDVRKGRRRPSPAFLERIVDLDRKVTK